MRVLCTNYLNHHKQKAQTARLVLSPRIIVARTSIARLAAVSAAERTLSMRSFSRGTRTFTLRACRTAHLCTLGPRSLDVSRENDSRDALCETSENFQRL